MALKAGYYGVKKQILDELNKLDGILPTGVGKNNKLIDQEELNALNRANGAHNLLPYPYFDTDNKTDHGITFVDNGDGSITVKAGGTASGNGQYFIRGDASHYYPISEISGKILSKDLYSTTINLLVWYYDSNNNYLGGAGATHDGTILVPPENTARYAMLIRVNDGTVIGSDDIIVYPMLRDPADKDLTYSKYAQTNQELTLNVVTLEGSASDQKTAINAIIAAASEESYAAFAAAVAAITPVTRSIQAIPEEVREEPEPETRTTKKSTKTTSK